MVRRMKRIVAFVALGALAMLGCKQPCGPGTVEKNGVCVVEMKCGPGTVEKDGVCVSSTQAEPTTTAKAEPTTTKAEPAPTPEYVDAADALQVLKSAPPAAVAECCEHAAGRKGLPVPSTRAYKGSCSDLNALADYMIARRHNRRECTKAALAPAAPSASASSSK